jgi:hypothetical protein
LMTFASHSTFYIKLFYGLHSTWPAESCCQTEHPRPPLPPPPLSPVAGGSGRHWPAPTALAAAAPYYRSVGPRR